MKKLDVDIRNHCMQHVTHCGKCAELINTITSKGLSELGKNPYHCFYKSDNISKYLAQCMVEAYRDKQEYYIKPTIISDGKYDHYNDRYSGTNDYELIEFILHDQSDILLVNGEAGIGKSSFINQLYLEVANYSLKNDGDTIPIIIHAENYGSKKISPEEWVKSQLADKYRYLDFTPALFNPNIKVVFLIDAINDIQYSDYNDFENKIDMWSNYIQESFNKYKNLKFVISSRYLDFLSSFEIGNYKRLYLQPFDEEQIKDFICNKVTNSSEIIDLINFVNKNIELPFLKIPFFLNKIIESELSEIKNKTSVIDVFLKSIFQKNNKFIKNRKIQTEHLGQINFDIKFEKITFLDALSKLAFDNQNKNKMDISDKEIRDLLCEDSQQFIDLAKNNSIFSKNGKKFIHPIFQEYFSAKYIFNTLSDEYTISSIFPFSSDIKNVQALKHVYNFITDKKIFLEFLLKNQRYEAAAECVLEDTKKNLRLLISEQIVAKLKESFSIYENANLGFLLGKLGDIRVAKNTDLIFLEPQVSHIKRLNLSVGVFPITNLEFELFIKDGGYTNLNYWIDSSASIWFNSEDRIRSICSFWYDIQNKLNYGDNFLNFCKRNKFDKELIANLAYFKAIEKNEFEEMIRDLYSEEKNSRPLMWENPTYNNPSQPVVGISVYEAMAYCTWLSIKSGKSYRLLTENEWESVAYADRKSYVYGNKFNPLYSNTYESKLKKIVPVGICDKNCTVDGVYDLSGNIYEWTSTIYDNPSIRAETPFKQYVCKGGSWIQDSSRAKSTYTGRGMGWVRNLDIGFRVCFDGC